MLRTGKVGLRARASRAGWVNGEFVDEVILGLLASDWARLRGAQ